MYAGRYLIDCGYPLVAETAHLCFGLAQAPTDKSIEELFAETLQRNDFEPLRKLANRLMEADYRLAYQLATSSTTNCYREFFKEFDGANFLTFNYDSLPEILLHHARRWYPHDGYGVPVKVETEGLAEAGHGLAAKSSSLILHLHGSFCLWTEEFGTERKSGERLAWLVQLYRPSYNFDPDSISACFPTYRRVLPDLGYVPIEQRVIAPVPGKADALKESFSHEMYSKALPLVKESGVLISVGYSFGAHDRASYGPIMEALGTSRERRLLVITPDANVVVSRIADEYPLLQIQGIEKTFKGWSMDSFRV
jgi:hypothetical protein